MGPRIIGNDLLYKYHFTIYGPLGKSLLFAILVFILLTYRKFGTIKLQAWKRSNLIWILLGFLAYTISWLGVNKMLGGNSSSGWTIATHTGLILSVIFSGIGCFGLKNIKQIIEQFKREIFITLVLSIGFIVLLYGVYTLWNYLAVAVLWSVHVLLSLVGIKSVVIRPHTLVLSKFGINISKYCSGIDSIALFTGLYIVIGVLDWHRLNYKRFLMVYLPALVFLFIFNILRVFVLVLGGYFIDPKIAFSLFHTYAGLIFFALYSLLFWSVSYKWITTKDSTKKI